MGIRRLTALNYIPITLKIVRFYNLPTAIALPSPSPKQRSRFFPLSKQRSRFPLLSKNSDHASLLFPKTAIALPSPFQKQRSRFPLLLQTTMPTARSPTYALSSPSQQRCGSAYASLSAPLYSPHSDSNSHQNKGEPNAGFYIILSNEGFSCRSLRTCPKKSVNSKPCSKKLVFLSILVKEVIPSGFTVFTLVE